MRSWMTGILVLTFLLALCACASQDTVDKQSRSGKADPESRESSTEKAQASNEVTGIENVREAVVYIEARGGVFDELREFGAINYTSGSGFIIDGDEGLIVTNNHVVTGAGYLEVYLDGQDEPVGAQVLGASECSDLALLKVDEEDLPYLEWREEEIEAGMNVRAAGYPATDVAPDERPDYTITQGTVNTLEADGETPWASIGSVLEHDALIRGGNSGGPLVDEEGRIVGINYSTNVDVQTGVSTGQDFAVSRDQAQELIDQLKEGDVEGIGINGEALSAPELEFSGILTRSVKTGSPADKVGLEGSVSDPNTPDGFPLAADIVTQIEGSRLGEQGTMKEYCSIVRDREPDTPLRIQIARVREDGSAAVLEGVLNGGEDDRLEIIAEVPPPEDSAYTVVTDNSETITMEVPNSWSDVSGGVWAQDELNADDLGPSILATPDSESFANGSYETPGAFFAASSALAEEYSGNTVDQILDFDFLDFSSECEYQGRETYDDGVYIGKQDVFVNCSGTNAERRTIVALPEDESFVTLLQIVITDDESREAAVRISKTFDVLGTP